MNQADHTHHATLALKEAITGVECALSLIDTARELHGDHVDNEIRLLLGEVGADLQGGISLANCYLNGKY